VQAKSIPLAVIHGQIGEGSATEGKSWIQAFA
jgi:hypothetical protein